MKIHHFDSDYEAHPEGVQYGQWAATIFVGPDSEISNVLKNFCSPVLCQRNQ